MKKRLAALFLAAALVISTLAGCGGAKGGNEGSAEAPANGGETVKIICGYGAGGTADLLARKYEIGRAHV